MTKSGVNRTALVDNIVVPPDLLEWHDFSVWIETLKARVLFATRQGTELPHNAARLTNHA